MAYGIHRTDFYMLMFCTPRCVNTRTSVAVMCGIPIPNIADEMIAHFRLALSLWEVSWLTNQSKTSILLRNRFWEVNPVTLLMVDKLVSSEFSDFWIFSIQKPVYRETILVKEFRHQKNLQPRLTVENRQNWLNIKRN